MRELPKTHAVLIDKNLIRIDPADIHRLLGEQEGMIDAHTTGLVEKYIAKCLRISFPSGAFILTEALESRSAEEISIPGLVFDSGKIIHKMLRHSERYALFVVTAGHEPEHLARSLISEGNYLDGYIVDLVASAFVDMAADQVQEQIRKLAHIGGLKITNRYSPGYCSWNVEEQQKLFSLFPEDCCGITLSDSSLMNPIKSISGIIGLGTEVKYRDYTCEICPMKDCHFRRVGDQ
jgi:hypothetical protein